MEKTTIELNDSQNVATDAPSGFLENIAFVLLLSLPFLLPLFFVPSNAVPFQFSKIFLLSVFVLISFACFILARLKDGRFVFPSTTIMLAGVAVLLVTALSGLFSGSVRWAFLGQAVDLGTVGSLGILFVLMFLVPIMFRSKDRIFYAYLVFFASFFLIAIFQLFRLVLGPEFLSFQLFTAMTSNTLGNWNDLGVFFGVGTMLSLITLELISLSKLFKVLSYVALVISLFFLAIVNFSPVWYVLALFSLVFLVYITSFDKSEEFKALNAGDVLPSKPSSLRKIPLTSLAVLLISLAFILGGSTIGGAIATKLNITQIEARPSWSGTFAIAKDVLVKDPFLGAGPNRFTSAWDLYKSDGINSTIFWNTDFNFGIGFIPTFLVTTGLLGAVAWVAFLGLFLLAGFKAILSAIGDRLSRYLVTSSFLVSLFLWIINIFYIPGLPVVALTFFFTGLFIASLYQGGIVKPKIISFIEDPKKGFVSVLCLILLLVGTLAVGYAFTEKFIASIYAGKGAAAFNGEGNIDKAESYIRKAVTLDNSALYYRELVQTDMMRMSALLSQDTKNVSADTLRTKFQGLLSFALTDAQQAVAIDGTDYQNWVSLGQVYEAVVPLKIGNAYESAAGAYAKALALNPKSPALLFTLARLEATSGNNTKAKDYIARALQQRNNYTEAIFLLAQIQVSEGNIKDAISSVEAASYLSPNDSGIFFQLGLLRYNNKDFQGASSAFEQAINLNPGYANAEYFLGLSYQNLGRTADAIAQFEKLKVTNPDNAEVTLILKNLKAGLAPFANATPPIDNQPQKRATPPVSEKGAKKSKAPAIATPNSIDTSSAPSL